MESKDGGASSRKIVATSRSGFLLAKLAMFPWTFTNTTGPSTVRARPCKIHDFSQREWHQGHEGVGCVQKPPPSMARWAALHVWEPNKLAQINPFP